MKAGNKLLSQMWWWITQNLFQKRFIYKLQNLEINLQLQTPPETYYASDQEKYVKDTEPHTYGMNYGIVSSLSSKDNLM